MLPSAAMSSQSFDHSGWSPAPQPETDAEHDSLAASPGTRIGRERLVWTAVVVGVGLLVFGLMIVNSFLPTRPELQLVTVDDVLGSSVPPAQRFGTNEIRLVGWFVTVADGCQGDHGGADASVAWLQRDCPLRVLLADQPAPDVSQQALEDRGIRLSSPTGEAFPPPTKIGTGTAGMEQLVFVGHFDDAATARCIPERADRCRNTFVATDYEPLIH